MITSTADIRGAIREVAVRQDRLRVDLEDGRSVSVPLTWYPRLMHASPAERSKWRLIGRGDGIHWPELDEDISLENILSGQPSSESQQSLKRWLTNRAKRKHAL